MPTLPARAPHSPLGATAARLWHRRGTILGCWLAATALGAGIARTLPPVYVATAAVELPAPQASGGRAAIPGAAPGLEEELARLRSRAFTARVRKELGQDALPPAYLSYSRYSSDSGHSAPTEGRTVRVRAESGNPGAAAEWANAAARALVRMAESERSGALARERAVLRAAARTAGADASRAEAHLIQYKRRVLQAGGDEALASRIREAAALAERARRAHGELGSLTAKIAAARGQLARLPRRLTGISARPNPAWEALNRRLAVLRAERARTAEGDGSGAAQKLDDQLRSVERALAAQRPVVQEKREQPNPAVDAVTIRVRELEANRAAAETLVRQLDDSSARMRKLVEQVSPWQVTVTRLESEWSQARGNYAREKGRLRELELRERTLPPAALLTEAALPGTPIRPSEGKQIAAAMLLGLLCGALLALLRGRGGEPVRSAAEAGALTGLPVLGVLPVSPPETRYVEAASPAARGYRGLGAALRYASVARAVRILAVVGPAGAAAPLEVAANLAVESARGGQRVLLVDTDSVSPGLHRRFALPAVPGWAEVRAEHLAVRSAIRATEITGLALLPGGGPQSEPAPAGTPEAAERLARELREAADLVILAVSRPAAVSEVGEAVDGVLLVAAAGETSRWDLQHLPAALEPLPAPLLGVVLIGGEPAEPPARTSARELDAELDDLRRRLGIRSAAAAPGPSPAAERAARGDRESTPG